MEDDRSEYELHRAEMVAKNKRLLLTLGLGKVSVMPSILSCLHYVHVISRPRVMEFSNLLTQCLCGHTFK